MIYALTGFVVGLLIPYMARRFAKSMPSAPTYALYNLIKPVKTTRKVKFSTRYRQLKKRYLARSMFCAVITAALSMAAFYRFGEAGIGWYLGFVWVLLLLAEVDFKTLILPDVLTIPLLICGFMFAAFAGTPLSPQESALAALAGYVLPVTATLLMLWRSSEAFGFGDIKLLSAIGAWLGVENVIYTILLSCVVFGIYAALRRERAGAFGPALAVSAIIILLFFN